MRPRADASRLIVIHPDVRGDTLVGTIDSDTVLVTSLVLQLSDLGELDRRGRAWKTGMKTGAVVGGVGLGVAAVVFAASDFLGQPGEDDPAVLTGVGVTGLAVGAVIGGTLGAIVGSAFTHWTPLELPAESGWLTQSTGAGLRFPPILSRIVTGPRGRSRGRRRGIATPPVLGGIRYRPATARSRSVEPHLPKEHPSARVVITITSSSAPASR